jgi:hypothetical protein
MRDNKCYHRGGPVFLWCLIGGSQSIPVLSQFNLSQQNFANQAGLGFARPDQDSKFKLA